MKIGKDKVVSIHYTLTGDDGEIIDSSPEGAPLEYLHGTGNIIPGLETALEGKAVSDRLSVTIPPEAAYGPRNPDLAQQVPRSLFAGTEGVEVGGQFVAETGQGEMLLTVTAVGPDLVTVDGNHPLAGATLHFDIEVVGLREASAEEIEHGHPHGEDPAGEGGCGGGCSCG